MSDFGLLVAAVFELDETEQRMLISHADHDVAYRVAAFANAIFGRVVDFSDASARNCW